MYHSYNSIKGNPALHFQKWEKKTYSNQFASDLDFNPTFTDSFTSQ